MRVLHVAPHPDDELLGAPATLMALRDAGHEIVNLACGLGRPADHERRRGELTEAARRAGFGLVVPDEPVALGDVVAATVDDGYELVVSPSPHDGHPWHEAVGRAVRDVLAGRPGATWWMWGLWADLPLPSLLTTFSADRLAEIEHALAAHRGELERADYRDVVRGRSLANRVLGPERVFGFGAAAVPGYAELLTEVARRDGRWWLGAPRLLGEEAEFVRDVSGWVDGGELAARPA